MEDERHTMKLSRWIVYALVLVVLVLHQDFWNFKDVRPLVFGFLPIGLAYHAAYSIACSVLMALLVALAWPRQLEKYEKTTERTSATDEHR
jgi:O-antigen ligase